MNTFTQILSNGFLLLIGVLCMLIAVALLLIVGKQKETNQRFQRMVYGLLSVGVTCALLSGAPLHYLWYLLLVVMTVAVCVIVKKRMWSYNVRRAWIAGLIAVLLGMAISEILWQIDPGLPAGNYSRIYVLGDSISAGLSDDETTWPTILAEKHPQWQVVNLARAGARISDAIHQADGLAADSCVVVLEIGGNDILNLGGMNQFEADLEQLLKKICRPDRCVVMLELPSAPLLNGYVRAQRELALRYHVKLVPRRHFCRILALAGSTTDGLHLSLIGHQALAELIKKIISPAML